MNSRERVNAALRHQLCDRVPFDFALGFSPYQLEQFRKRTGEENPDDYFGADVRGTGIGPTRLCTDFSRYIDRACLPAQGYIDEWGQGHIPTMSSDQYHSHLEGYVYPMLGLHSRQDALDYPLPDIEAEYRYEPVARDIKRHQDRGLAVMAGMACTIFEVAWGMRSMELLLMDFVDNPEFAEVLLDRITRKRIVQAERYAELGPDAIMFGDDVATQRGMLMSVPMWQRWLKPRLARVIEAARRANPDVLIFYHSDGNATAIVPDLIEIGVQILNPVQPECMDPFGLKKAYGDRLSYWGTLGTQSTLPFGTPDDVRRDIKARCEIVGKGGGLLIAPTHMVEPEVPWENLVAFVEAVKEYGRYG
jgi:uroporphyrinogen decarboxylase